MKLLIATQAVDQNDPVLGFFCNWLTEFASHVERIEVICLKEGEHHLPENVRVYSLGKEKGRRSRVMYAVRFKYLAWKLRAEYDTVLVHMNPEYVLIAGPLWRLLGKRVSLWYNHPHKGLRLAIATTLAHKIFYTSPYAATARLAKAKQMPAGIDTDMFKAQSVARNRHQIYMQGRIMPSKRVDLALEALRIVREKIPATLTLVGPEDAVYGKELRTKFADLISAGVVTFAGPKANTETPRLYGAAGASLNLASAGHFDKSVLEAMATETPIVLSSKAFIGLIPDEWIVSEKSPQDLASALIRLLELPEEPYQALGEALRERVIQSQSLTHLATNLTQELEASPVRTRPFRALLWGVLHTLARVLPHRPRMTVLFYHSVSDTPDFFAVSPKEFDRQMAYLKKYTDVVPLERAFAHAGGKRVTRDSVAITLDDGYRDFVTNALPILKRRGVPVTVFALAGTPLRAELGNDHQLLSPDDVVAMSDALVSIGSHAQTHRKLSKIPLEEARQEMKSSRELLAEKFGKEVSYLAYPKGSYNNAVMRTAEEVGYVGAVSVIERGVKVGDSRFALPRVQVDSSVSFALFTAKLSPAVDWYYALWRLIKRRGAK